jgi:hypothetical protein
MNGALPMLIPFQRWNDSHRLNSSGMTSRMTRWIDAGRMKR